jgi:5'-nucleotidase
LSLENGDNEGFQWSAEFVRWWLTDPHFAPPPPGIIYNVNFPSLGRGVPSRLEVVRLGTREYVNDFQRALDPRGREYYWISGERLDNLEETDTDVAQHHGGAVTLTPLHMQVTSHASLDALSSLDIPKRLTV